MTHSLLEELALLTPEQQQEWLDNCSEDIVRGVTNQEWWVVARPEQKTPEGDWTIWLILSGRGWGKTRTGAEWVIDQAIENPLDKDGLPTEWGCFAQTNADGRLMMVEGPSGLLNVLHKRNIPFTYTGAPMKIVLPQGQKIHIRGADDPDVGRGMNLAGAWLDEVAKWRYAQQAWIEGIAPGLRTLTANGVKPRAVVTTTPKPIPLLTEWVKRTDNSVHVTRGSTFDNAANLSSAALEEMKRRYEGTRIGRQELYGELLFDVEGALWNLQMIESARVTECPTLVRIVVAIDPAVTSNESSDETGIVVAGLTTEGQYYVLDDVSLKASPDTWAKKAVEAYHLWKADRIIGEANNGGDMIGLLLKQVDINVSYTKVTASRGKQVRAEPISALYEQGRVHHVGVFEKLETQMCEWTPDMAKSPDRMDALVWALTELSSGGSSMIALASMSNMCQSCGMPSPKTATICFKCGTQFNEQ